MRIDSDVSTVQRVVLLLAGVVLGSLMVTPGVAHVGDSVAHLKTHLDDHYVVSKGSVRISTAPQNWVMGSNTSLQQIVYLADQAVLSWTSQNPAANQRSTLGATLPASLYGKATRLTGAELCYDATHGGVLSSVRLSVFRNGSGLSSAPEATVADLTNRTDEACRTYQLSSPFRLTGNDFVSVEVLVDYPHLSSLGLGRTTFKLVAT